jgi:hypothetical protein
MAIERPYLGVPELQAVNKSNIVSTAEEPKYHSAEIELRVLAIYRCTGSIVFVVVEFAFFSIATIAVTAV